MKQTALANSFPLNPSIRLGYIKYFLVFIAGLLAPFGFAPFHIPGLTLISLAFFYSSLQNCSRKQALSLGFFYGIGYFGFGVSWVIVSIHDYGQLNYFLSGLVTLIFIMYLSLFPALVAYFYKLLEFQNRKLLSLTLFCVLWCLSEYCRANLFTGFPWLFVGTPLIDTPIKYITPVLGVYGLSLLCVLIATLLTLAVAPNTPKRPHYLIAIVLILISPMLCKNVSWSQIKYEPISIGAVQANLSMRDKWDETLFWNLLKYYENAINKLLGKQLIILPESAIPLPASYLDKYLLNLNNKALKAKSALMLGILQPTNDRETNYYNSVITLGQAKGKKLKRQLVPFGEYIPKPLVTINRWLNLPEPNLLPGKRKQSLIRIENRPIASLICYEIAYPEILREQMPKAQWIVSISDNGWFGHSLAGYQQLQMAQILSLLTGRYQVVVNNDGLSSVIDANGDIIDSLPPFSSGLLQSSIFPAEGLTPWIIWQEYPSLIFCSIFLIFVLFIQLRRLFQ
ncbi:apolipoprotein N-acyltransferase [Fluoribacter dumoffii]|uniref:apolipoprotein N-acyltransferase n=1 Tax=Fluoribacter dumoffii TaxID=463 RepID=UPI002244B77F|nr:apolipoprotein N-acyltransferase [Fluoribacter dumoffii]MCW8385355.1 apolipoprotein N-acyltransferase [Fluoribacter dumoffii]MCW8418408.1 apolipoprotein N-acyltransferase [Fluoribacter dumoffii]MCW8453750.1 apolipoprotein N-acyltransferase [Fluoribacter dumoffii]MCW8462179.1 apolipoprotein N-acyltransferase [Fluoribacter dumoffii]MCW8482391.1 apolipoprotein N-acyltransferase [Fluoribacter dumoffii]